jgi:hypothetical protein
MRISRLAVPACALLLAAGPLSASASVAPLSAAAPRSAVTVPSTAFLPNGQGPGTQLTGGTDRRLGQTMSLGGRAVAAQPGTGYGADGTFAGLLPAGTRPAIAAPPDHQRGATATLTVDGTNLAGQPDTGDTVVVANVDNSNRTRGFVGKKFADGAATFTVPLGHYLVLCYFLSEAHHKLTGTHVVVLPQVTVAGNTTADAGALAADSRVQVVTPRPADLQWVSLDVYRWTAAHQLLDANAYSQHQGPIWISPTATTVTVGSLRTSVAAGLVSPPGTAQPYLYNLVLEPPPGRIPAMREVVRPARLATVTARYYQAAPSLGELYQRGLLPFQGGIIYGGFYGLTLPCQVTEYLSGTPSVIWFDEYAQARAVWTGGQIDAHQAYVSGQQVTQNWGAYPLHSAPDASILGSGDPWARQVPDGVVPTANRMGDSLELQVDPFGDNTPGHTGDGYTTGHYQIDQNGIKIAGGNAVLRPDSWAFLKQVTLSPQPSLIRFTLTATRSGTLAQGRSDTLSTATSTTWTWRSARAPGVKLPPGWWCGQGPVSPTGQGSRACAVQPLLTLRYAVQNMALNGAAPAGLQIVRLSVGHLQLAQAAPVTAATMQFSLDGGQTWHRARITGRGGSYTALFTAPPAARITLRTTATTTNASITTAATSITETTTNAYATAP